MLGVIDAYGAEPLDPEQLASLAVAGWVERDSQDNADLDEGEYINALEHITKAVAILKGEEILSRNEAEDFTTKVYAKNLLKKYPDLGEEVALEHACFWDVIPAAPKSILKRLAYAEVAKDVARSEYYKKLEEARKST